MKVRWKFIPGYEGFYQASTSGRVRSVDRRIKQTSPTSGNGDLRLMKGRELKKQINSKNGYLYVGLSKEGVVKDCAVHVLVLLTFRGPRPKGKESAHLNGKRGDARLSNLGYKTPVENAKDRQRHGTYTKGKAHAAYRHGRYCEA